MTGNSISIGNPSHENDYVWHRTIASLEAPPISEARNSSGESHPKKKPYPKKKTLVISESSNKGGSFWIDTWHSNKIAVRNKEGRILRGRAAENFGFGDSPTSFSIRKILFRGLQITKISRLRRGCPPDCQDVGRIQSLEPVRGR